ncbi:hypothetical protein JVT61DRAFT_12202 [Boletus reticuloceps]|uniref:Uncharacterized protein n=1 Tax=Boletus reticuloceps TaxID=495285 RepID=A0A8I2YED8_9AGAM|nr:hypothetical protein JVT61DRAFT_12202 [Boletus reticuloceps]
MLMLILLEPAHPKAKDEIVRQLRDAFQSIDDPEFRNAKDGICIFKQSRVLLKQDPRKLAEQEYMPLLQEVLVGNADQAWANVRGNKPGDGSGDKRKKSILGGLRHAVKQFVLGATTDMERLWNNLFRQVTGAARNITDSQFLTRLGEDLERFAEYGDLLRPLAEKAKESVCAQMRTWRPASRQSAHCTGSKKMNPRSRSNANKPVARRRSNVG